MIIGRCPLRPIRRPSCASRSRSVGFRNIAVHAYEKLDPAIVEAIVENDLDDLRRFVRIVLTRFGTAGRTGDRSRP